LSADLENLRLLEGGDAGDARRQLLQTCLHLGADLVVVLTEVHHHIADVDGPQPRDGRGRREGVQGLDIGGIARR
jgi:hypothetical protein